MDELESKILSYRPNSEAKEVLKDCPLLLLVGSTGSGKDTLATELLKTGKFVHIISHTSRPLRYNHGVLEQDGKEYHFVTDTQALTMLEGKKFIEAAYTHGHLYGTSVAEFTQLKSQGKIGITDIDVKGIRSFRQLSSRVTAVFLLPPSFDTLISRLKARYGESNNQDELKVRLKTAIYEFNELLNTDYYYALVNDDLRETVQRILDIVDGRIKASSNPEALALAKTLINDSQKYLETV